MHRIILQRNTNHLTRLPHGYNLQPMKLSRSCLHFLCAWATALPFGVLGQDARSTFLDQSVKPIPIRQGTQNDLEELDLGNGKESAVDRYAPSMGTSECDAKIAHGASVGIWQKNFPASNACAIRLFAKTQLTPALSINNALWCSDLGNRKAQARALFAAPPPIRETNAVDTSGALASKAKASLHSFIGTSLSSILLAPSPKPLVKNAVMHEPSRDASPLFWDAKERELCAHGGNVSPELAPSLTAYAPGKITTPNGTCDATIIEANLMHGRYALSRISWIQAKCPGYVDPNPRDMADAISTGLPGIATWQSQHFAAYQWQGPSPRPARGRLADAR